MKIILESQAAAKRGSDRKPNSIEMCGGASYGISESGGKLCIDAKDSRFYDAGKETLYDAHLELTAKDLKKILDKALSTGLIKTGFRVGRKKWVNQK